MFLRVLLLLSALIPEAIAFSIIAGVDPKVGLCFILYCCCDCFVGGRPGMISCCNWCYGFINGHTAKEHGLQYLLAATILTGFIQILAGYLKLGALMRFVSKSVVIGFVNALAILIFMAQLLNLPTSLGMFMMTIGGLAVIYLFPYIPVIGNFYPLPSSVLSYLRSFALFIGLDVRTVGDMGAIAGYASNFLAL